MNEDKMREEFEVWVKSHGGNVARIMGGEYTSAPTECAWDSWKAATEACAAIKDAEIAARDLMIKELRDEIQNNTDLLCVLEEELFDRAMFQINNNERILMKSEHHNSRALEKMLLEARIDALEDAWQDMDNCTVYHIEELLDDSRAKLAELNKE